MSASIKSIPSTSFMDMQIWQRSRVLCGDIYSSLSECNDYAFKDQVQRASISIMNNIAEGSGRSTQKDFAKYLYIAKGSCNEVSSLIYIGSDLTFFDKNDAEKLQQEVGEITKMVASFIAKLESNI